METPAVTPPTPVADAVVDHFRTQRREMSRSRGKDDSDTMQAFLAERTATSKHIRGNRRKQMAGNTL